MSAKTFYPKRDSSSRLAQVDPVLVNGEIAVELDTRKWKVGDGARRWAELAYQGEWVTWEGDRPAMFLGVWP